MKISNENVTIKYDNRYDYRLYRKGELVGHIPPYIGGFNMKIEYYESYVRLICNGFILAGWKEIEIIKINEV